MEEEGGEQEIQMVNEPIIYSSTGGAVSSVNGYTGDVVLTTSDLENTSDYQTGSEVSSAIAEAVAGKQDTLTAGENITIVDNVISATGGGATYTAGNGLILSGNEFAINPSVVATQSDLSNKQDVLTAGSNITIQNNTISATDTTYTAGYGLGLSGTQFAVNNAVIATQDNVTNLQGQIDALAASSDVTDIVGTYADLMAYGTSTLTDKDIIGVLNDETHGGESTYYRYSNATDSWTYIGSTGQRAKQSDWDEDDSTDMAFIKNKPFYSESVDSDFDQEPTTTSGSTPDTNYVWFIEQFQDYALHEVLADFNDGDTVYATITYLVNGVERSDTGKFTLTYNDDQANLDYDALAGSRWYGAYITEVNLGDTTVRWPVLATDSGATVYITNIEYSRVKQVDAEYIPIDNDTITVDANGKLKSSGGSGPTVVQTIGNSTTDVMSQNAATGMIYANPGTNNKVRIYSTQTALGVNGIAIGSNAKGATSMGDTVAIGTAAQSTGNNSIAIGPTAVASGTTSIAMGKTAKANNQDSIAFGASATASGNMTLALGYGSTTNAVGDIAIGGSAKAGNSSTDYRATAIGQYSSATAIGSTALGAYSSASAVGQMDIGSTQTACGYNSSNYRLLTGVYDGQSDHDAATVGQLNSRVIGSLTAAPTTSTAGAVGALVATVESGTGHLYICTDDTGGSYTWQQLV